MDDCQSRSELIAEHSPTQGCHLGLNQKPVSSLSEVESNSVLPGYTIDVPVASDKKRLPHLAASNQHGLTLLSPREGAMHSDRCV